MSQALAILWAQFRALRNVYPRSGEVGMALSLLFTVVWYALCVVGAVAVALVIEVTTDIGTLERFLTPEVLLAMVFVIRKMRMCDDLKDYKVCLVNDRKDLEKQLGETAELTGEKVTYIARSEDLKAKLKGDKSDLNMVMIHKFKAQKTTTDRLNGIPRINQNPITKKMVTGV